MTLVACGLQLLGLSATLRVRLHVLLDGLEGRLLLLLDEAV